MQIIQVACKYAFNLASIHFLLLVIATRRGLGLPANLGVYRGFALDNTSRLRITCITKLPTHPRCLHMYWTWEKIWQD